jgi:hypothetical protein
VSSHGTASWTAENASYTASDEAFGQSTLNAYKAATLIKVSEELLQDSAFDLEAYIRDEFGSGSASSRTPPTSSVTAPASRPASRRRRRPASRPPVPRRSPPTS